MQVIVVLVLDPELVSKEVDRNNEVTTARTPIEPTPRTVANSLNRGAANCHGGHKQNCGSLLSVNFHTRNPEGPDRRECMHIGRSALIEGPCLGCRVLLVCANILRSLGTHISQPRVASKSPVEPFQSNMCAIDRSCRAKLHQSDARHYNTLPRHRCASPELS